MKTIPQNCSDAELSAVVAIHVAGWMRNTGPDADAFEWITPENGRRVYVPYSPTFATSADAVLPLLVKTDCNFGMSYDQSLHSDYAVQIHNPNDGEKDWRGYGPTFARAACFALLRAHGITLADGASERGTTG